MPMKYAPTRMSPMRHPSNMMRAIPECIQVQQYYKMSRQLLAMNLGTILVISFAQSTSMEPKRHKGPMPKLKENLLREYQLEYPLTLLFPKSTRFDQTFLGLRGYLFSSSTLVLTSKRLRSISTLSGIYLRYCLSVRVPYRNDPETNLRTLLLTGVQEQQVYLKLFLALPSLGTTLISPEESSRKLCLDKQSKTFLYDSLAEKQRSVSMSSSCRGWQRAIARQKISKPILASSPSIYLVIMVIPRNLTVIDDIHPPQTNFQGVS